MYIAPAYCESALPRFVSQPRAVVQLSPCKGSRPNVGSARYVWSTTYPGGTILYPGGTTSGARLGTINVENMSEMAEVVYHLVRRGLTFKVEERGGVWTITLTGGF